MTALAFKVDDKITKELDLIKKIEGLGNRTATFAFLVKYYFLTRNETLEESVARLNQTIAKLDWSKIPSMEEQLKEV